MADVSASPFRQHCAIIKFPVLTAAGARVFEPGGGRIKLMLNCPKCGTAVRAEKAFCHNCGSPMDAVKAERETPLPDFGATILEPPRRPAPPVQSFVPPVVTEVQGGGRPTAPASYPPAGIALPAPSSAPPATRRKSSRRIGVGFVLLLLFLMFLAFALAIVLD